MNNQNYALAIKSTNGNTKILRRFNTEEEARKVAVQLMAEGSVKELLLVERGEFGKNSWKTIDTIVEQKSTSFPANASAIKDALPSIIGMLLVLGVLGALFIKQNAPAQQIHTTEAYTGDWRYQKNYDAFAEKYTSEMYITNNMNLFRSFEDGPIRYLVTIDLPFSYVRSLKDAIEQQYMTYNLDYPSECERTPYKNMCEGSYRIKSKILLKVDTGEAIKLCDDSLDAGCEPNYWVDCSLNPYFGTDYKSYNSCVKKVESFFFFLPADKPNFLDGVYLHTRIQLYKTNSDDKSAAFLYKTDLPPIELLGLANLMDKHEPKIAP